MKKWFEPNFSLYVKDFDILAFAETWSKKPISFGNYICYSIEKEKINLKGRHPGGLAILVKSGVNINSKRLKGCSNDVLWIQLTKENRKFILGCAYRPPNESNYSNPNFFLELEEDMQNWQVEYPCHEVVVVGDFNARVGQEGEWEFLNIEEDDYYLKNLNFEKMLSRRNKDSILSNEGKNLISSCSNIGLFILNGRSKSDEQGELTFISENGCSTIDLALVYPTMISHASECFIDLKVGVEPISAHLPLELKVYDRSYSKVTKKNIKSSKPFNRQQPRIFETPKINEFIESSRYSILKIGIDTAIRTDNCQQAILNLEMLSRDLASYARREVKENIETQVKNGWFDRDCAVLKGNIETHLQRLRAASIEQRNFELSMYLNSKKIYKADCRAKKRTYDISEEKNIVRLAFSRNTKEFWGSLGSKYGTNRLANNIPSEVWVDYYRNLFQEKRSFNYLEFRPSLLNSFIESLDREITENEIQLVVNSFKNNKTPGMDGIPPELYKAVAKIPEFLTLLCRIFNKIFNSAKYPSTWDTGMVAMMFKGKGEADNPDNYRGISLLNVLSKIFCKTIAQRLQTWAETTNRINIYQAGFRKNYSPIDDAFVLNTLIEKTFSKKRKKLYSAYIDYKRAFDSVNRQALWFKLNQFGVSTKMLLLLQSIYSETKVCIKTGPNEQSEVFRTEMGVRQGCQLSSFLFTVYVNDAPDFLLEINTHPPNLNGIEVPCIFFADDDTLLSESIIGLQRALDRTSEYCKKWLLEVNIEKTKILVFSKGSRPSRKEKWFYNGQELEIVSSFNYLGVQFSKKGAWSLNIENKLKKAKVALGVVRRNLYKYESYPVNAIKKIFIGKIQSILTYGGEIWALYDERNKIDQLITMLAKEVLGVKRATNKTAALSELGWLPTSTVNKMKPLNYYVRFCKRDSKPLQQAAMHELKKLKTGTCWLTKVKTNLLELNIDDSTIQRCKEKELIKLIKKRSCHLFELERQQILKEKNYPDFVIIKSKPSEAEKYVKICKKSERSAIAKFRIVKFTWDSPKDQQGTRICPLCSAAESLKHILIDCIPLQQIREETKLEDRLVSPRNRNDVTRFLEFITFYFKKRAAES